MHKRIVESEIPQKVSNKLYDQYKTNIVDSFLIYRNSKFQLHTPIEVIQFIFNLRSFKCVST